MVKSADLDRALKFQQSSITFWMLLVGINEYEDEHLRSLQYAVADCRELEEALDHVTGGFKSTEKYVHCVDRRNPSRNNIITSLQQISQNAGEDDIVLFYFSGHGYSNDGKTYLCLPKTQLNNPAHESLMLSEFLSYLLTCNAKKQIMLVDACHSGDSRILNSRGSRSFYPAGQEIVIARSADVTRQGVAEGIIGEANRYKDNTKTLGLRFFGLLSCDEHQESYEDPSLEHGIFTSFLIKGLQGDAADRESGIIRPLQLFSHVANETRKCARKYGLDQTPRAITNGTEFEIGKLDEGSSQNSREKRQEEFKMICREVRRQGDFTEEDQSRLEQQSQRLSIRKKVADDLIDELNHQFEQCENKIKKYIESENFPIRKACNPDLLNEIRKEDELSSEDIKFVWKRIFTNISEQFKGWQHQLLASFQEYGSTYEFSPESLPIALTEINVRKTVQDLRTDFAKREDAYQKGFADCVAEYWDEIDANAYPEALEATRQTLLADCGLNDGKPYVTSLEKEVIAAHNEKLRQFEAEAKTMITQYLLPLPVDVEQAVMRRGEEIGLLPKVANQLIAEFQATHHQALELYKSWMQQSIRDRYPEELTYADFQTEAFLAQLGDTEPLLPEVIRQLGALVYQDYDARVKRYRQLITDGLYANGCVSFNQRVSWLDQAKKQRFDLSERTAKVVLEEEIAAYNAAKTECKALLAELLQERGQASPLEILLGEFRQRYPESRLRDDLIAELHQAVLAGYQRACQGYKQDYRQYLCDHDRPTADRLRQLRHDRPLCPQDMEDIETRINQERETTLNTYRAEALALVRTHYPLDDETSRNRLFSHLQQLKQPDLVARHVVEAINQEFISSHQQALSIYAQAVKDALSEDRSLEDEETQQVLSGYRAYLSDEIITQIHRDVNQKIEDRLNELLSGSF